MRRRLTIGEVAKLTGVTTKTVRHYHKIGLLSEPERSEGGYRLYSADDLLRLQRVRRLRSFGLSLARIKTVLGEPEGEHALRKVLEALLAEVSGEIEKLEERRRRLEELLAQEDPEVPAGSTDTPYALKLVEEYLGEHLEEISAEVWEQERKVWSTLDDFEWPEGYEEMQETIAHYYAGHPDKFREMLTLEERLAALADLPEDAPEVWRLAEDFARHLEKTPFPHDPAHSPSWSWGPLGDTFVELLNTNLSPAQRRVIGLLPELVEKKDER